MRIIDNLEPTEAKKAVSLIKNYGDDALEMFKEGKSFDEVKKVVEGGSTTSKLLKETTCSDDELYVYLSKQVGLDAAEAFSKKGIWPSEVQIPKNSSALNSDGCINWSRP